MENKCVVESCVKSCEVDLFVSPQDPVLLKKWQKSVHTRKRDFFVCAEHFSKKDIVIDKNLEENAVPLLHLSDDAIKLENECCGACLEDLDEMLDMTLEMKNTFLEITTYEPLTDYICRSCQFGLAKYIEFQDEIKIKHAEIRNSAKAQTINDEDKMEFEDQNDEMEVCEVSEFSCVHCGFKAINNDCLLQHINSKHRFKCYHTKCNYRSASKINLQRHLRRFHAERYECCICLTSFNSRNSLNSHRIWCVKDTGAEGRILCFFCCKRFSSDLQLKDHMSKTHSKKSCKTDELRKNIIEAPRSIPIKIIKPKLIISKVESIQTELNNEKKVKKKITPQRPRADILEEIDIKKVRDKLPIRTEKPKCIQLKCADCKTVLGSIQELLLHRENSHPEKVQINEAIKRQVKKAKCKYCHKDIFEYCMRMHIKLQHPNIKLSSSEYSCHLCFETFKTRELKNFHLRDHQIGDLICTCDFCGKEFGSKQSIKSHMEKIHLMKQPH